MTNSGIICYGCYHDHNQITVIPVKNDLEIYECKKCGCYSTGIDVAFELKRTRAKLRELEIVEEKLRKAYISKEFNRNNQR